MSASETGGLSSERRSAKPGSGRELECLLAKLDVRVEPFAVCDVRKDFELPLRPQSSATFHYVLLGRGRLWVEKHGSYPLARHSVAICPPNLSQRVETTDPTGPSLGYAENLCVDTAEGLAWLRAGQGERRLLMACGRLPGVYGDVLGLFEGLRRPVVESFEEDRLLHRAFRSLLEELADPGPGTAALTTALMKQCLILVLRRLYQRQDTSLPWLAALCDPRLASALRAMLAQPSEELSVSRLAELSGMSRSAFSHHFTQIIGAPPHEFLRQRRLELAARLLVQTSLPVKTVAGRVGFKSRSHFSHAFREHYGIDPLGYRTAVGEAGLASAAAKRPAIPLPS
jgi:AraC-like DNA-binding protein